MIIEQCEKYIINQLTQSQLFRISCTGFPTLCTRSVSFWQKVLLSSKPTFGRHDGDDALWPTYPLAFSRHSIRVARNRNYPVELEQVAWPLLPTTTMIIIIRKNAKRSRLIWTDQRMNEWKK